MTVLALIIAMCAAAACEIVKINNRINEAR